MKQPFLNPTPEFVLVLFMTFVMTCICYCAPKREVDVVTTTATTKTEHVECYDKHGHLLFTANVDEIVDIDFSRMRCYVR